MVITVPALNRPLNGPRPINLSRDIPQLVELLELAFGEAVDSEGQRIFKNTPQMQPAFLWRLNPSYTRLAPGYVWEENGRIIGNVTLLPTKTVDRYLVANVAVHPRYRRQGIARLLMGSVIEMVRARQGRHILLQVAKENDTAIALYHSLGFVSLGSVTSWLSAVSRVCELDPGTGIAIRPLPANRWREAYQLDRQALHPDLNWPDPLPPDGYKGGFWRWLDNFLNGRQVETWATTDNGNHLTGLAAITTEWGRAHVLSLRVHPGRQGQLERPLLAKLIRRLRMLPRRNVRLDHLDSDTTVNELLKTANFRPQRTLTHMRLELP
jgi:ribosomal protein S18 acetylase RimI-like enzyme